MKTRSRPLVATFVLASLAAPALAQQTISRMELASAGPTGLVGNYPADLHVQITPDSRYVLFSSYASNFVAGDTNGNGTYSYGKDVYLRDRQAMTIERMTLWPGGVQPNQNCDAGAISADGRFVVIQTNASNVPPGGNWTLHDQVYVVDRTTGAFDLVSVNLTGGYGFGSSAVQPSCISDNGRYVVFTSTAWNVTAQSAPYTYQQVYRRDRQAGFAELVSVPLAGGWPLGESTQATISADGRYVCFLSEEDGLIAGDTNGWEDVFVRDMQLGITQRASVRHDGSQILYDTANAPGISRDGRFVVFTHYAQNIVPYSVPLDAHCYVRDLVAGTNELASVGDLGQPANDHSFNPAISTDGRYVVFDNWDGSLTGDGDLSWYDVYRRDRWTGTTVRASVPWNTGQANAHSRYASVADDGTVAFWSGASNHLTADTNGYADVFVRSWASGDILPICPGDGLSRRCPCDNHVVTDNGCASSFNPQGGGLAGSGAPAVSADTLLLTSSGTLDNFVTYLQGDVAQGGGYGSSYGDGLLCAATNLIRLKTVQASGGVSQYPGPGDIPVSIKGMIPPGGGVTRIYQVVYRDPASYCVIPYTYNATSALSVLWSP